jgi:hypothetical protein
LYLLLECQCLRVCSNTVKFPSVTCNCCPRSHRYLNFSAITRMYGGKQLCNLVHQRYHEELLFLTCIRCVFVNNYTCNIQVLKSRLHSVSDLSTANTSYPTLQSRFNTPPRQFLDSVAHRLNIKDPSDWYQVTQEVHITFSSFLNCSNTKKSELLIFCQNTNIPNSNYCPPHIQNMTGYHGNSITAHADFGAM